MKYFFVLGNNEALSVAEILAVIDAKSTIRLTAGNILIAEMPETDTNQLIKRLGGTIKIGQLVVEVDRHSNDKVKAEILKGVTEAQEEHGQDGKFCFGISHYGKSKFPVFPIGLDIKKILKQNGASVRMVTSREKTLSSVVVEQNNLTSSGIEIILIEEGGKMLIGYTEAVQAFKELSYRDFGRPARDDESGMIPPKLAQIMLNMSGKISADAKILDPFCGSGTILMEAALMGVSDILGSDISPKAIADSRRNMEWSKEKLHLPAHKLQLLNISATEISQKIKANLIDAIVCEPYLGPQRGKHEIQKTINELERMYAAALKEFYKILKPDGRIVMIWPVFTGRGAHQWDFLNPNLGDFQIVNPLPTNLQATLKSTRRGSLIYGRENQKVYREIVVLKK